MSNSDNPTGDRAFEAACAAIGLPSEAFWFRSQPAEQAERLTTRIKVAAKLLGQSTGLGRSQALDLVLQALRFLGWHLLAAHLARAEAGSCRPTI